MKLLYSSIFLYMLIFSTSMISKTESITLSHSSEKTIDSSCPSGYTTFYEFNKVIKNPKYKCYGKPSGRYQRHYCPNRKKGTCFGSYTKQQFCKNGKRIYLYHTNTKCTCGCINKNFHGHDLNILDLGPCGCEDNLEEKIGVGEF